MRIFALGPILIGLASDTSTVLPQPHAKPISSNDEMSAVNVSIDRNNAALGATLKPCDESERDSCDDAFEHFIGSPSRGVILELRDARAQSPDLARSGLKFGLGLRPERVERRRGD
jgi:hypothetical protein